MCALASSGMSMPDQPSWAGCRGSLSRPNMWTCSVSHWAMAIDVVSGIADAELYAVMRSEMTRMAAGVSNESHMASWNFWLAVLRF